MMWFLVFCVVLLSPQSSSRSILDMENELALRSGSRSPPAHYTAPPLLPLYAANIFAGPPSPMPRVETTTGIYARIANNIAEKLTTPFYRWLGVSPKMPNIDDPYIDVLTRRRSEPVESEISMYKADENNKIKSITRFTVPLPGYVKLLTTRKPKQRKNYLKDPNNLKVIGKENFTQGKDKREDSTTVESETKMPIEALKKLIEELNNKYKNLSKQNNSIDNNDEYSNIMRNPVQDVFYNKLNWTDNDSNSAENKGESVEEKLKYLINVKSTTEHNVVQNSVTTEIPNNLSTVFDMPSTLTTKFVKIRVKVRRDDDDDLEYEELGANEGHELTFVSILELIGSAIYTAFASLTSMFRRKKNNNQS